jgi:hypothetical protein
MKATLSKVKDGRWFVSLEGYDVTAVFDADEHDLAVASAYNEGATDFTIKYSPRVIRKFDRDGIVKIILNKELQPNGS